MISYILKQTKYDICILFFSFAVSFDFCAPQGARCCMQIRLYGDKKLVFSAVAEENECGVEFLIDANDKSSYFHRRGGSLNFSQILNEFGDIAYKLDQMAFQVYQMGENAGESDEPESECEVVFIAENEREKKLLRGLYYEEVDRGQYSALCIQREKLKTLNTLAVKDADEIKFEIASENSRKEHEHLSGTIIGSANSQEDLRF